MIVNGMFDGLDEPEIAAVLSLFLKEDNSDSETNISLLNVPSNVKLIIEEVRQISNHFMDIETQDELYMNMDWNIGVGMMEPAYIWSKGINNVVEGDLFDGDFVKAMLKLTGICQTVGSVSELLKKHDLVIKMKHLETTIMRGIVNVDSLYIL